MAETNWQSVLFSFWQEGGCLYPITPRDISIMIYKQHLIIYVCNGGNVILISNLEQYIVYAQSNIILSLCMILHSGGHLEGKKAGTLLGVSVPWYE